jgi:hypothetical protein
MKKLLVLSLFFVLVCSVGNLRAQQVTERLEIGDAYGISDEYYVSSIPCDPGTPISFAVCEVQSDLCPNLDAVIEVYINGVLVFSHVMANPLTAGVCYTFNATCGDDIRVVLRAVPNNNPVLCKRMGDAKIDVIVF